MPKITKHAKKRLLERVHARGRDAEKLVSKAYKHGTAVDKLDGTLQRWVRAKMHTNHQAKNTRLYKSHLYIFDNWNNLVTVLEVPDAVKMAVETEKREKEQLRKMQEEIKQIPGEFIVKTCNYEEYTKAQAELEEKLEFIQEIMYDHHMRGSRGRMNLGIADYTFICSNMDRCGWIIRMVISECESGYNMQTPDACRQNMCELLKIQESIKEAIMYEDCREEIEGMLDRAMRSCSEIYERITGEQIKVKIKRNSKSCFSDSFQMA